MKTEHLTLQIEKMVFGGDGFSHYDTQACFVTGAIAGERVHAKVEKEKKQFIECSCMNVLEPSAFRQSPVCPVFNECGGCQWQHITYEHQLYWKRKIVEESLLRIAGFRDVEVKPVYPSSEEYYYRNRSSLKLQHTPLPRMGFFKNKSHDVVDVKKCYIINRALNSSLHDLRNNLLEYPDLFRNIVEIGLLHIESLNKTIVSYKYINGKRHIKGNKADNPLYEDIMGISFRRDIDGFSQVNTGQNREIIKLAIKHLEPVKGDKFIDLYCGCGNFSLFLAKQGAEVTGYDINRDLVNSAEENAWYNSIKGCRFEVSDLYMDRLNFKHKGLKGVLINPPRTGCSKNILLETAGLKPELIVYVSCNPSTLARDLKILSAQGYNIEDIQPVDMFPQTYHIETIVRLTS